MQALVTTQSSPTEPPAFTHLQALFPQPFATFTKSDNRMRVLIERRMDGLTGDFERRIVEKEFGL
jgi:hypothetical protein